MSNELEEVKDSQGGQLATQRTWMERVRLDARSTIVAYKSSWRELLAIYALAPALAIAVLYPLVVLRDAEVLLRLGDSVFLMLLLVPLLFPLARILAARATLTDRSEPSRGQMLSFEDLGFGELAEHLQTRNVHDAPLAEIGKSMLARVDWRRAFPVLGIVFAGSIVVGLAKGSWFFPMSCFVLVLIEAPLLWLIAAVQARRVSRQLAEARAYELLLSEHDEHELSPRELVLARGDTTRTKLQRVLIMVSGLGAAGLASHALALIEMSRIAQFITGGVMALVMLAWTLAGLHAAFFDSIAKIQRREISRRVDAIREKNPELVAGALSLAADDLARGELTMSRSGQLTDAEEHRTNESTAPQRRPPTMPSGKSLAPSW